MKCDGREQITFLVHSSMRCKRQNCDNPVLQTVHFQVPIKRVKEHIWRGLHFNEAFTFQKEIPISWTICYCSCHWWYYCQMWYAIFLLLLAVCWATLIFLSIIIIIEEISSLLALFLSSTWFLMQWILEGIHLKNWLMTSCILLLSVTYNKIDIFLYYDDLNV